MVLFEIPINIGLFRSFAHSFRKLRLIEA